MVATRVILPLRVILSREAAAVILSERSERKDRFRATAVKALDGQRSFRRFATLDDSQEQDVARRRVR